MFKTVALAMLAIAGPQGGGLSGFWYSAMDHIGPPRGYAPNLQDAAKYNVYVAVRPGDGAGIQDAITSAPGGQRNKQWLASQPRVVYIPPGTYEISKTIFMQTDTVLMGDATDPPVIKAAKDFSDQVLINGQDPSTKEKGENSFAIGLKNFILDTTAVDGGKEFTALYWGLAQVSQLQNIKIQMPSPSNGQGHSGIRLGRGSTLALADVRIEKGQNGIWHDTHQQALYKNIHFYKNEVGMLISGGHTISLLAPVFDGVKTGIQNTEGSPFIGVLDGKSTESGVTLKSSASPSILIHNLETDNKSDIVELSEGTQLKATSHVDNFSYGNTVGRDPVYGATTGAHKLSSVAAPGGRIPSVTVPNFASNPVSDFINIKDAKQNGGHAVKGDGTLDEAEVLNKILEFAASKKKIAYFPYGDYRVESTLVIPIGSQIVGEAWSTISGGGKFFKDASRPKPVVQVGKEGDVGVAQIQDMRFTVSEVLPGAIIVQFQAAGSAPGDVALFNSLITVGGTKGAPGLTDSCKDAGNPCQAAYLGLHFAKSSSAYVENVWNWVADHITEDFDGGSSIAGKGGALVESTKGTWLHALGSEHWWLYQLNLRSAENVVVTLLQSETNYEQGDNAKKLAPAPWKPDAHGWGDPDFAWCKRDDARCRMGLANYIQGGSDVAYFGSASWVFFSGPGYQECAGRFQCQKVQHWIEKTPKKLQLYGMCTKDTATALRLGDGTNIGAEGKFEGGWNPGAIIGRYTS
ncbi:hypothetical protein MY10362_008062 [Beauveria mimosiformis]